MKNQLFKAFMLLSPSIFFGQIGINTTNPKSTLDVVARIPTGTVSTVEGLLIPRVDRQRLQSMISVPTSTMIYVNDISTGTLAGTTVNVDTVGFYIYNGTVWSKLVNATNFYNADGTLTDNRTLNLGTYNLNILGPDSTTTFANNGNVGIGTSTPKGALDVTSTSGGFIPPRMTNSQRNALSLPPTSSIIFNTDVSQLQYNTGTAELPVWAALSQSNTTINTLCVYSSSAVQTVATTGTAIKLGKLEFDNTGGFVTYNTSTNKFTLKAGKIYELEFSANWVMGTGGSYARFRWRDTTTNTYIGTAQHYEYASSQGNYAGGGNAFAYISPTVDTSIEIVYSNGNSTSIIVGDDVNGTSYPSVKIKLLN